MSSRKVMVRTLCVIGMVLAWALNAFGAPMMRYPNAAKTEITFVAYDDLWVVPLQGGVAHRLTHDPGAVTTPLFSPDGHWIAYTLRRGGLHDVFVIPAEGGQPR
jgi:tricorn protease